MITKESILETLVLPHCVHSCLKEKSARKLARNRLRLIPSAPLNVILFTYLVSVYFVHREAIQCGLKLESFHAEERIFKILMHLCFKLHIVIGSVS